MALKMDFRGVCCVASPVSELMSRRAAFAYSSGSCAAIFDTSFYKAPERCLYIVGVVDKRFLRPVRRHLASPHCSASEYLGK